MSGKRKLLWYFLLVSFVVVDIYMLFHNLGKGYLIQTDEAYHATNAYEMFKQGNWIINTYRYAADYFNSKPPLCLDLMIVSYKILGVSGYAARFPSALGGLITCIVIIIFLLRDKKIYAAAAFPMLLAVCKDLFTFHMYRAAEMDAVYNLFFALAMIALYEMSQYPNFMYVYGIAMGLAFMCKGPHAVLIFVIGLLYIPKITKAFSFIKRVVLSALLAAIIPVVWMVKRYMFDGFKLFDALFMGEVVERVSDSEQVTSLPITEFLTSNIVIVFAAALVVTIITAFASKRSDQKKGISLAAEFVADNYLFLLWAVVPVVFFAVTKSYLTWYTYTSQIAMCVLTCRLIDFCIRGASSGKVGTEIIIAFVVVALSLFYIVPTIVWDINLAGTGGHPVDEFTEDLMECRELYGDSYSGKNAYLVADFKIDKRNTAHWEPEYVAPAEMYLDLIPVDGTVENFLSDPNSILILDKDLWDEYSGVLTGHVIIHDNSYLIFSSDMY